MFGTILYSIRYPAIVDPLVFCGGDQNRLTVVGDMAIAETPAGGSGAAAWAYGIIKTKILGNKVNIRIDNFLLVIYDTKFNYYFCPIYSF